MIEYLRSDENPSQPGSLNSEVSLREIFENLPVGVISFDTSGKLLFLSDITLRKLKMTNEQALQINVKDLLDENGRAVFEQRVENYRYSNNQPKQEYKVKLPDGQNFWVEIHSFVNRNPNGKIKCISILIQDITERKKAEADLIEREKLFKSIFKHAGIPMILCDKTGHPFLCNPEFEKLIGYDMDALNNMHYSDYTFPADYEYEKPIFSDMMDGKIDRYQIEKRYICKSKKIIWGLMTATSVRDEEGHPQSAVKMMEDITEIKHAREALIESELKYRSLFQNMTNGFILFEALRDMGGEITDFKYLEVNPVFEDVSGVPAESVIGKTTRKALGKEFENDSFAIYKTVMETGQSITYQRYSPLMGKHLESRLFRYAENKLAVVFSDISERVRMLNELESHKIHLERLVEERTNELAQVNQLLQEEIIKQSELTERVKEALDKEKDLSDLKSRFISTASHQFRTPLTTIYSSAQLLERYGRSWDDEMYIKQLGRIKEYVQYLTEVMDDVLIISRTETGKIKFEPRKTDLKQICVRIIEDFKAILTEKHNFISCIKLKKKFFMIDEKLLKNILLNLLSNAVKYSPAGGMIEFSAFSNDDNIIIKIADEGIGINEEDQSILFEPFHRGGNVGDIHGSGLGLSIVKRCVEMHRGTIKLFSSLNKGTTFIINLPLSAG